ncbi:uncharacterized protein MELLADRAFT_102491 [Melampsora larici-populina 98AG31]|uniref:Uncharacterized protein n=1 Tax=Melampsora larici-populina (strain 98AG31 / pathotype 3-4-7) TaxID=747676 RepID=F4R8H6_MELLP|nr:uncharacterized protein MELLADRAFT_102491 [Melampsora larici-populina 98AG31]EGG11601.1 hypothetical protein MELLADRAFT_102491 [Melampsora larici-populina 98AG31]
MSSSSGNSGNQATPSSPDVTWMGTTFGTGFSPQGFLRYNRIHQDLAEGQGDNRRELVDPRLRTPESEGNSRDSSPDIIIIASNRGNNHTPNVQGNHPSPRAQRELERLEEYQRRQRTKQEM